MIILWLSIGRARRHFQCQCHLYIRKMVSLTTIITYAHWRLNDGCTYSGTHTPSPQWFEYWYVKQFSLFPPHFKAKRAIIDALPAAGFWLKILYVEQARLWCQPLPHKQNALHVLNARSPPAIYHYRFRHIRWIAAAGAPPFTYWRRGLLFILIPHSWCISC